jgi:DNA-binding LytR/AlgR family response regulator
VYLLLSRVKDLIQSKLAERVIPNGLLQFKQSWVVAKAELVFITTADGIKYLLNLYVYPYMALCVSSLPTVTL